MEAGADGEVVGVDHTLYFGGFGDWVEICGAFDDLDYLCCDRFPGGWGVGCEKHFVESFKVISEGLYTV